MKRNILIIVFVTFIFRIIAQNYVLNDGTYEGRSSSIYGYEQFKGITIVTIKKGKLVQVSFQILDTVKNELFNQNYASHYPNQPLYQKQCVEDWKGVLFYPDQLLKKQDIRKVDAISGATWSHNLFVSSATIALKKASIKTR